MKFFDTKQETTRSAQIKRISWLFLWGSLMPILAISGVAYFYGQIILQNQAIESLLSLNNSKSKQLDLFIEKVKVHASGWSADGKIYEYIEKIQNNCLPDATILPCPFIMELSTYLKDKKMSTDPIVVLVDILDLNGIVIASSDISRLDKDESKEHTSFFEASRAPFGEVFFSIEPGAGDEELADVPMLGLMAPILLTETNKIVGVLLVHTKTDELNKILAVKDGKTLETYLVNHEKLMITPSRFIPNAVFKEVTDTPPVRACLDRGKDYQGSHLDYRGEPVFGVSKCLPDRLGVIITEIDESEAFESISVFRNIISLAIAIILAFVLIYILLSGKTLLPTTTTTTITTTTIIIIIIIIGASFSLFFSNSIGTFAQHTKTEPVYDLIQGQVNGHVQDIKYFSDWRSIESQQKFEDFIYEVKSSLASIIAVNIYNKEGILIWSDLSIYKEKMGKKHEIENVTYALAKGQLIKHVEEEIQKQFGSSNALEIYVPVYLEDKSSIVGVVEVYFDTSDLVIFIQRLQIFILLLIGVSLASIYFLLTLAFRKQNDEIHLRTEESLKEKARLVSSINSLSFGFIICSSTGDILISNPVLFEILNVDTPFKNISDISELFPNFDLQKTYKDCVDTQETIGVNDIAYKDKILKISFAPVVNANKIIDYVILIEDTTEVKLLDRSKDEFFAVASHELRTPLTAIRGNSDMILDTYKDKMSSQDVKEMLTDINNASIRLIAIVNSFLEVSRLEQGKIDIKLESFDLSPIIDKVISNLRNIIGKKKVSLTYSQPVVNIPHVFADQTLTEQVFINLLSNAIKYTDEGSIVVTLEKDSNFVTIKVIDTGRGIDPTNQLLLFKKFQQAGGNIFVGDYATSAGLGLYISKLLVKNMNGNIGLEQSKSGLGSTFYFTLPVAV